MSRVTLNVPTNLWPTYYTPKAKAANAVTPQQNLPACSQDSGPSVAFPVEVFDCGEASELPTRCPEW